MHTNHEVKESRQ